MAKEVAEESVAAAAAEGGEKSKRKKPLMLGGVILGIMLLEGVGVFMLAKHFAGPPSSAEGAESEQSEQSEQSERGESGGHGKPAKHGEGKALDTKGGKRAPMDTEVEGATKIRAQNEKSQVPCTYDITWAIKISEKDELRITDALNKNKATVQDRLTRVVRSLDPQRFTEPDLATLRQSFKHELSQVVGEGGGIKEVLIPSIVRYTEN